MGREGKVDMTYIDKGYQSLGLVPEVHHRVAADQRVHKADHMMLALSQLLSRHLIGYDVEALIHLEVREGKCLTKGPERRT